MRRKNYNTGRRIQSKAVTPLAVQYPYAEENGVDSIAFCCISTGVLGFPQREAAKIAFATVKEYKAETGNNIKVIFNVFKDDDPEIYGELLANEKQI